MFLRTMQICYGVRAFSCKAVRQGHNKDSKHMSAAFFHIIQQSTIKSCIAKKSIVTENNENKFYHYKHHYS